MHLPDDRHLHALRLLSFKDIPKQTGSFQSVQADDSEHAAGREREPGDECVYRRKLEVTEGVDVVSDL